MDALQISQPQKRDFKRIDHSIGKLIPTMLYFIKLLFPAVLLSSLATASKLDLARDVSVDLSERHLPSLTAVTVRSGIQKREEAFIPKRDCEHHYADRMYPSVQKL